jgi:hypothetical protein
VSKIKVVNGWPDPHSLSKEKLVEIVMAIQGILWAGEEGKPDHDREWGCEEIENVALELERAHMKPEET